MVLLIIKLYYSHKAKYDPKIHKLQVCTIYTRSNNKIYIFRYNHMTCVFHLVCIQCNMQINKNLLIIK